jgi:hypothetical protein
MLLNRVRDIGGGPQHKNPAICGVFMELLLVFFPEDQKGRLSVKLKVILLSTPLGVIFSFLFRVVHNRGGWLARGLSRLYASRLVMLLHRALSLFAGRAEYWESP